MMHAFMISITIFGAVEGIYVYDIKCYGVITAT